MAMRPTVLRLSPSRESLLNSSSPLTVQTFTTDC
jgi:hypothetical protein